MRGSDRQPGDQVVITEDATTRGTSLMEAVDIVRELGAEPVLVTVTVDRGGATPRCATKRASRTPRCSPHSISGSNRTVESTCGHSTTRHDLMAT